MHTQVATTTVVRQHIVRRTLTQTVEAAPPPEQGFDYGAYSGEFRESGLAVREDDVGFTHIAGQLEYTGGEGCSVLSYVEVSATFFDSAHRVIGTGISNIENMSVGSWYPFDATTDMRGVSSASATISQANC